jgi:hypothetical protein
VNRLSPPKSTRDDFGFAPAGGYAVQAHRIVQRLSDDVDLFAPIERRGEMPAATERIVGVLGEHGYRVEVVQQAETYVRLMVTDPLSGHDTKIELVAEFLQQPPVASEWGPVLHRDAAGKIGARRVKWRHRSPAPKPATSSMSTLSFRSATRGNG